MKRVDLIRLFLRNGWEFEREGSNHTIYRKGKIKEEVPRHREVDERLAKSIIRRHNLK